MREVLYIQMPHRHYGVVVIVSMLIGFLDLKHVPGLDAEPNCGPCWRAAWNQDGAAGAYSTGWG